MNSIIVNSKTCEIGEPEQSLLAFLRSGLGLTGAKPGCGEGTTCRNAPFVVDPTPVCALGREPMTDSVAARCA